MIDQLRASMRDRMWAIKDIAAYYGCNLSKAWRMVAQPGFPPRRPPYPGADPVWSEREVREWAETREAA